MLALNPREVGFGSATWSNVTAISIARSAETSLVEFGDDGPYATLVDVPRQRVTVEVTQEMLGEDMDVPVPSDAGSLTFATAPSSATAGTKTVSVPCVVERVWYEVSVSRGSYRKVKLIANSSSATSDPVSVA